MTLRPRGLFSAHRFVVRLPDRDELLPVHSIFQDPFTGALWVGRAQANEPMLMQRLVEATSLEVWLLPRACSVFPARCLPITCEGKPQWFPIDFDSSRLDVAMEWLCWSSCEIGRPGPVRDVPLAELPPSILKIVDPRSDCE